MNLEQNLYTFQYTVQNYKQEQLSVIDIHDFGVMDWNLESCRGGDAI